MEFEQALKGRPEILAPAGNADCFLAALAAGADAVYLGLKQFSARMEAENFGSTELARLVELAHRHERKVYVAMNTLVKPGEAEQAFQLIRRLASQTEPDGLIVQDLGLPLIARAADFKGAFAFSTLANISDATGLEEAQKMGASRVIIPRELSLDEMRILGQNCPEGLGLECFVQGALCYCVSGRCYWSSYMGGKSGLRGRCVQPCRRMYAKSRQQKQGGKKNFQNQAQRFFSCQDLEIGALARQLLTVPNLVSWKIEGRKKGPHYVYHTVIAYRMLADYPDDAAKRRQALEILSMALGRPGVTARFLPQKKYFPMSPNAQTGTGKLAGKARIMQDGSCALIPHFDLLPQDYLRIGTEDEAWHAVFPIKRAVPKHGTFILKLPKHKTPKSGTPVFLLDRREPELQAILSRWQSQLEAIKPMTPLTPSGALKPPPACQPVKLPDITVGRNANKTRTSGVYGLWLGLRMPKISATLYSRTSFWLPPVIWPEEEDAYKKLVRSLWRGGARGFVCNAPWQRGFFPEKLPKEARLIAGPFCNIANAFAIESLKKLGFMAAFASPELSEKDYLELPAKSPLPMGLVLGGFWPVGISRFGLCGVNTDEPFQSPHGEAFWARNYGGNVWIYPAWPVDIESKKAVLQKAGYSFFAWLAETPPANLPTRQRPGLFNWEGRLL